MDLVLNISQKLALSQRMLQSAEILQMSSQELVNYIKELSIENPVVDYEETVQDTEKYDILKKKLEWLDSSDEQNKTYYREDKEDESSNDMWNFKENVGERLVEYLYSQVNVLPLNKEQRRIAHYIIESMDNNGYLADTVEDMAQALKTSVDAVKKALQIVQSLEPAGVGARNLKECLFIQLKKIGIDNKLVNSIIESGLETLAKNQLHILAKKNKATIEDVVAAVQIIKSLNPKPGNSFTSDRNLEYITPDVLIEKKDGQYEIILNDYFYPRLSINNYYKTIMNSASEDKAKEYVYDKIKQAEWAMKCISKRNSTLVKTLEVILDLQKGFFDQGPGHLKPMKLYDVAERIGMHESTVSRAVRDKYLQCSWGVFSLNSFFSTGVAKSQIYSEQGEENEDKITPSSIKAMIKKLIDEEDKKSPYSDRAITELLNEKGIQISRRTVAKYREAMHILGTSGRKSYEAGNEI